MPDTCPTCNHDERSSGSPLARIRATLGLKVKPARCPASEPDVYGGQGSIECNCRDTFHGS